jgi:hypothetical protein
MASSRFTLALAVMPDDLAGGDSSKGSRGDVPLGFGLASFPGVLFLVDVHIVVAVVVLIAIALTVVLALVGVSFVAPAAMVDFLDSALVVVVLFVARGRAGNLSVLCYLFALNKLVGGLWGALADDDGLRCFLPDDDGRHLHGLGDFIADIDGLGLLLLLGLGLGAEVLGRSGVLLELIRLLFPREDVALALVVPRYADFCARWRRGALVRLAVELGVVAVVITAPLRRGVAVHVAVLPLRRVVALNDVLLHRAAVVEVVAPAVHEAHLGFVRVFLEAVVRHLVAPYRGIAASSASSASCT